MLRRGSRRENSRWRQHEDNSRVRFREKRPGVVKWFGGNRLSRSIKADMLEKVYMMNARVRIRAT